MKPPIAEDLVLEFRLAEFAMVGTPGVARYVWACRLHILFALEPCPEAEEMDGPDGAGALAGCDHRIAVWVLGGLAEANAAHWHSRASLVVSGECQRLMNPLLRQQLLVSLVYLHVLKGLCPVKLKLLFLDGLCQYHRWRLMIHVLLIAVVVCIVFL